MVSDLKIEIFAHNIFHIMWCNFGEETPIPNILELYGDECSQDNDYKEVCDYIFAHVISLRHVLFQRTYMFELTNETVKNSKSLIDCYEYVVRTCDREDLFGHLTVFQRMFATLTFVTLMCLFIYKKTENVIDIVKYGHIFWAMYFDKFTDEFYEKGGWIKLKTEAKIYKHLPDFDLDLDDVLPYLKTIKEASINYGCFKNVFNCHERNDSVHISLLWIVFQIEHCESYIKVPLSYQTSIDAYEVEILLENVLNPSRCNSEDVKIDFEKIKINDDNGGFHSLLSKAKKITSEVLKELSDMSDELENLAQSTHLTSKTEGQILNIIDKREDFEFYKSTFTGIEMPRQMANVDSTKNYSHIEQNIFPPESMKRRSRTICKNLPNFYDLDQRCRSITCINKIKDSTSENFYEAGIEEQAKIPKLDPIVSINKMKEIENHGETSPKDRAILRDLTFQKENANIRNEATKEKLNMSFNLKSERESVVAKATDVLSVRQMFAYELAGKTASDNLPALKVSSSSKENINSDEKKKITKAWEELKKEQKDPDVKNFLKMILVLNDKEGIKFVLSTLQRSEGTHNHPMSSNKQKNKSKRKKHGK